MSNLSGNGPTNEYGNRPLPTGRSNAWVMPTVIVVGIIVIALAYGYSQGWMNRGGEHAASTTADPAPSPSLAPATPTTTPKP